MSVFTHSFAANTLPLMPYPASVKVEQGKYQVANQLSINIDGVSEQRKAVILAKINKQIASEHLTVVEKTNQLSDEANESANSSDFTQLRIVVDQQQANGYQLPTLKNDESYQLIIDKQGIKITANTEFGVMQGVATLAQLMFRSTADKTMVLPLVNIVDSPRFSWRGLMIDSVRHFISIDAIKRQLDGMSAAKLNVFHWHLTDDQGWRIESKTHPKLHQLASDNQYYTQQEIADVVDYASLLGIRVVPEFDLPGHASAIAVAYPELISVDKPYTMEDKWGVFEPLLDPSNEKVYQFIDSIVGELVQLFPDQYLHIGGDEVHPVQWKESTKIQQFMTENNLQNEHDLQVFFNKKVQLILAKHKRRMMGWDEIYHPDLPKDIMVQSWRGMESLTEIASQDYQGLLSTGFYIDQPQSTSYHYRNEPLAKRDAAVVSLEADDKVQAWKFTMPRLKGSAVKGRLVLVSRNDYVIHAYVKLNKNKYQKVDIDHQLALTAQQINLAFDSWMGPVRAEFDFANSSKLKGRMLIGNTHYAVQGAKLSDVDLSSVTLLASLPTEKEQNIIGGEATLWSELVDENNIDVRAWPRVFAIAERFWSAKELKDTQNMYQRLFIINDFATKVGLKHQAQFEAGLQQLVLPKTSIEPLMILSEQLEPAHYYTRHHIKYQKGFYHQHASLKRFVDYLPVESLQIVKMQQQLRSFKKGNKQGLQNIINTLHRWHFNFEQVIKTIKKHPKLSPLLAVAEDARTINTLGLTVAQNCLSGVKINKNETKRIKQRLHDMHANIREVALASGLLVEKILDTCRK